MPPTSAAQQRLIFALARQGTPWAVKYLKDAPTMQVVPSGDAIPSPERQYDAEKAQIVKKALKRRGSSNQRN